MSTSEQHAAAAEGGPAESDVPTQWGPQDRRLPFLDGIRGIAILSVFLFHALRFGFGADSLAWNGLFRDFRTSPSFLSLYPLTYGWAGVSVFFVVSGFCIHWSHQQGTDKSWAAFFRKRFLRIYPPYIAAVVLFSAWPWRSFSIRAPDAIEQLGFHVLAIHNLDSGTHYGINPSFWSIAVEIQLYALYPLLLTVTRRMGWGLGLAMAAGLEIPIRLAMSVSSCVLDKPIPHWIAYSPFAYWLSWSVGAYLAQCRLEGRSTLFSGIRCGPVVMAAFLAPVFKPTAPFAFLFFSLLTAVAIDRRMSGRWTSPKGGVSGIAWSHMGFLGVVSYSFYLFHQPIFVLTQGVLQRIQPGTHHAPLARFLVCCLWYPPVLAASWLAFRFIEKPSMALARGSQGKHQTR